MNKVDSEIIFRRNYFFQSNCISPSRRISPDVLPSCSPGVFRQKSFRLSTSAPSKVPPAATLPPTIRNSRDAPVSATNDRCTAAIPTAPSPAAAAAAVSPRDSSSRTVSTASLSSLSRGTRAASKHARLGTALASKMATANTSTVVQGWPNTKDDYELKEVIGEYRSPPCGTRQLEATIASFEYAEDRAHLTRHRPRPRRRAPLPSPASNGLVAVVFLATRRLGTTKVMTMMSAKRESPFRTSYRSIVPSLSTFSSLQDDTMTVWQLQFSIFTLIFVFFSHSRCHAAVMRLSVFILLHEKAIAHPILT